MTTKFDKPFMENLEINPLVIGNLFTRGSNFDLEGLRRIHLTEKVPLNILNNNNDNLIHVILRTTNDEVLENRRLTILKYLISKGVHPDLSNKQGITPLHIACENQYPEIIKYLLECGVNPNSQDSFGKTPFHYLLAGSIKQWINKQNKNYILAQNKPKDLTEKVLQLKKDIFEKISPELLKILNDNIKLPELSDLPDLISKLPVLEEFEDKKTEDIKTKVKDYYKIQFEKFKDTYNIELLKLNKDAIITEDGNINNFIDQSIKSSKNELSSILTNNQTRLENIEKRCLEIKNFPGRITQNDLPVLNENYPYLDTSSRVFISNSSCETSYDYHPDIQNVIDNIDTPYKLIYQLFLRTFTNNDTGDLVVLPAVDGRDINVDVSLKRDENIETIITKIYGGIPVFNVAAGTRDRFDHYSFLYCILAFYSPNEIKNLKNYFSTRITPLEELEPANGVFQLFYYLFEYIAGPPPGLPVINLRAPLVPAGAPVAAPEKRLWTTHLDLVNSILNRDLLLNLSGRDLKIKIQELTQYNLAFNINNADNIDNDLVDKIIYSKITDKTLINEIFKNNGDNVFDLIKEDRFNIQPRENREWKIYNNDEISSFFTNLDSWIHPSILNLVFFDKIINRLSKVSFNQSFYIKKIVRSLENGHMIYLGDVSETNKSQVQIMLRNILCKIIPILKNILLSGKFPLLSILNIDDTSKFDKYWGRVVSYHLKSFSLLSNFVNIIIFKSSNLTFKHQAPGSRTTEDIQIVNEVNYNEMFRNGELLNNILRNIGKINLYLYLEKRLTTPGDILELENFYYYDFNSDIDNEIPLRVLSYGRDRAKNLGEKLEDDLLSVDNRKYYEILFNSKLNTSKLRINKSDNLPILETDEGKNTLFNLVLYDLIQRNFETIIEEYIQKFPLKSDKIKNSSDAIKNLTVNNLTGKIFDIIFEIIESNLELIIYRKISDNTKDIQGLKSLILKEFTDRVSLEISSTDVEFKSKGEPLPKIHIFPIIEQNKLDSTELYFSNDYAAEEFVLDLYEIKFDEQALVNLVNGGGNPYLVDKQDTSAINILTSNYLEKPLTKLKEIGLDLRQKDENGYDFIKSLESEIDNHKKVFDISKGTTRDSIKETVDNYFNKLKLRLESIPTNGFNHFRYTRLALELTLYYLLVNDGNFKFITNKSSNVYENDFVLARQLISKTKGSTKTFDLNSSGKSNILEVMSDFMTTFKTSPAVFLREFERIISEHQVLEEDSGKLKLGISKDFATEYFKNVKLISSNKSLDKVYNILELVVKQVVATQIIYLLTNLINAHFIIKFPTIDDNYSRARIIEDEILGAILPDINQNITDLIRDKMLPKLLKNVLGMYDDDYEERAFSTEPYELSDFTNELKDLLLMIPLYFNDNDNLIENVFPNFLNSYLDMYIPELFRNMRYLVDNSLKWVINYEKLQNIKKSL